jgi:hypothetical protein
MRHSNQELRQIPVRPLTLPPRIWPWPDIVLVWCRHIDCFRPENIIKKNEYRLITVIHKTVLSLVLNGKRDLTREHIGALSKYFDVNPAAFLGPARSSRTACVQAADIDLLGRPIRKVLSGRLSDPFAQPRQTVSRMPFLITGNSVAKYIQHPRSENGRAV